MPSTPKSLLDYLEAIERDDWNAWTLIRGAELPNEEALNLMINVRAKNILEGWLAGSLSDVSLLTPYQQEAYQLLRHPLFDLAMSSNRIMEQLTFEDELPFKLSSYSPDDAAMFVTRYSLFGCDLEALKIRDTKQASDMDKYYLDLSARARGDKSPVTRALHKLHCYEATGLSATGENRIYPREGEAILPDAPGFPTYNLFKNRLRSTRDYRNFLEWIHEAPNYSSLSHSVADFPEAERKVVLTLCDYYRK